MRNCRIALINVFALVLLLPNLQAQTCSANLSVDNSIFGPGASSAYNYSVAFSGSATCTWTLSADSWIALNGATSGYTSGTATGKYTVQANTGSSPRHGTITLALNNQNYASVAVDQNSSNCSVTLSNFSPTNFPLSGGNGSGTASATPSGCWFEVGSPQTWITFGNQPSVLVRSSPQQISFAVAASTAYRTGSITVASDPGSAASVNITQGTPGLTLSCTPATGPTQVGVNYSAACSATGGTAPYTWSVTSGSLPGGITLSSTTGANITISGAPTSAGPYSYSIQVADSSSPAQTQSRQYSGTVNAGAPTLTSISPASGAQGTSPTVTLTGTNFVTGANIQTSNSGIAVSTVTLVSSTQLIATFVIAASAPTGQSNVTVVTPAGTSGAVTFTVTTPPMVTTTSLPTGAVGASYSGQLTASGGTPPYSNWTISSGTLPNGISLNSSSGALTGKPTASGTSNFSVTVKDSAGVSSAAKSLSITVANGLTITTTTVPKGTVGASYTAQLGAAGGNPPYNSWAVSSGSLPGGLNLNANSGLISGTPTTAGTSNFSVTVKDSQGVMSAAQPLTIVIAAAPAITTSMLPMGFVGTAYTANLSAAGGTTPYAKWSISTGSLPPGLNLNSSNGVISGTPASAAGSPFTFSVQVTDSAGATSAAQSLSIAIGTLSLIVAPTSLTFNYRPGDPTVPDPQSISIFTGSQSLPFTVSAATTDGGSWLMVSASNQQTPGSVTVSVNTARLNAGTTYTGQVTTTVQNSSLAPVNVPVTLIIAPASSTPTLTVAPSQISLSYVAGSAPVQQPLVITNSGGGTLQFSAQANGSGWLSGSASGRLTEGQSAVIMLTIDPSSLMPSTYYGSVTIQLTNPPQTVNVPVTVGVSGSANTIQLSQKGLQFTAATSGLAVPDQSFTLSNGGLTPLGWTLQTQYFPAGNSWLTASANAGICGPGATVPVTLTVNSKGLAAGQYYAVVQIFGDGAANSPQSLTVLLNVVPPGMSGSGPQTDVNGVMFVATQGAGEPPDMDISLYNVSGGPASYTSTSSSDTGNWLSQHPPSATVGADKPATLSMGANPGNLPPGVYHGTIRVAFDDGTVHTIRATMIVVSASAASVRGIGVQASCRPTRLALEFQSPESEFSAKPATPQNLGVVVKDDCGNALNKASVSLVFSNRDRDITVMSDNNGVATATWTPGNNTGKLTVTATGFYAASAVGVLSGQSTLNGSVVPSSGPPAPKPSIVQNSASYQVPPTAFAPGSWVSVFGDALADSTMNSDNPYPNQLGGAQILLGSSPLPLHYVSANQVNALIPYGLPPNTIHSLYVARGNSISVPLDLPVADLQPGIFTVNQAGTGQGVIVNGVSNVLADTNGPVTAGDVITIYCTGLGEVNNEPAAGTPAPFDPNLATTLVTPGVTIGNVPAPVQFSGLTPGAIGLYQVNAQVPPGVPAGDAVPVVITVPNGVSNTVTIAVR